MIEEPVLSFVVGNDFTVVARTFPATFAAFVALDDGRVVIANHLSALLVDIWSHEFRGAPYYGSIGTILTFAA